MSTDESATPPPQRPPQMHSETRANTEHELGAHDRNDVPFGAMRLDTNDLPSESSDAAPISRAPASSSTGEISPPPRLSLPTGPSFSGSSDPPAVLTPITGLRLQTDHLAEKNRQEVALLTETPIAETKEQTVFNAGLPVRQSSIRSTHTARSRRPDSISPGSAYSSPGVGPLVDMTPLPSPISIWGSPHEWKESIDEEKENGVAGRQELGTSLDSLREPGELPIKTEPKKRKIPFLSRPVNTPDAQIRQTNVTAHAKNRSISDYVPDGMQVPPARNVVVSTYIGPALQQQPLSPPADHLHREEYLAIQRGLTTSKPPTPPDSNQGRTSEELERLPSQEFNSKYPQPSTYEAYLLHSERLERWRSLRKLGEGQFSRVMLATSAPIDELQTPDPDEIEHQVRPRSLVAVKVCHHGPAGGADEQKVGTSIKREVEILKAIDHPSLVHLMAVNESERTSLLVLNYCPGGDLFELASSKPEVLTPPFIRRIFAELIAATQYLHAHYIVHRDIKLENILINLSLRSLAQISDFQTYPFATVTLTDLGLGRRIPEPPSSPLLSTRCGSEDYAAPEVLMGSEYDGRSTDAWALGVVLYALLEGRLPFDPIPGRRRSSPTSHRIARCEWQWIKYADSEGEWDPVKGKLVEGAREIVEGLLARLRSRKTLAKVAATNWVTDGMQLASGQLTRLTDRLEDADGDVEM